MQTEIKESVISFVVSDFQTDHPTQPPLVVDNAPFDWASPPELFTAMEIQFLNGEQVGVVSQPKTRLFGVVYVQCYARQGTGWKRASQTIDWFADKFKYGRVGTVLFQEPKPLPGMPYKGYQIEQLKVPFFSDPT